MEWTHKKALELIDCYKKHTVLWDIKNINYKKSVKKFEAWAEIAHMLNTDIYEVRRKMQSMLASFRRERHKSNSKWFGVDHLQFLLDIPILSRTKKRRLISSENDNRSNYDEPLINCDNSSENNKIYDTNDNEIEDSYEMEDLSENDNNQSVLVIVDSDDENECRQLEEELEEESMQIEPMIEQPNNLTLMNGNLNEDLLLSQSSTQPPTSPLLLSPSSTQIPQIVSVKSLNEKAIATSNTITSSAVATTTTNNTTSNTKSTSTTTTTTTTAVTVNTISVTQSNGKECKFVNNVINKLRNYDSNTRAIVQHLLNNILFEAEMGNYNNEQFNPTTFLDESIKDIEPKLCYDSKEQFVTAILSGTINADICQQPQQHQ